MLAVTSHATITGSNGAIAELAQAQARRRAAAAASRQSCLSSRRADCWPTASASPGAMVRGMLPEEEAKAVGLGSRMTAGRLEPTRAGKYRIILGSALATELGVEVGQTTWC